MYLILLKFQLVIHSKSMSIPMILIHLVEGCEPLPSPYIRPWIVVTMTAKNITTANYSLTLMNCFQTSSYNFFVNQNLILYPMQSQIQ